MPENRDLRAWVSAALVELDVIPLPFPGTWADWRSALADLVFVDCIAASTVDEVLDAGAVSVEACTQRAPVGHSILFA
ncbi:hypothetical protein [Streptomyces venezuelae]|uniref:hypothetical protein n=1 Tax=Streptomyces venezuelae TaxID=54571 RepID=UPI00364E6928